MQTAGGKRKRKAGNSLSRISRKLPKPEKKIFKNKWYRHESLCHQIEKQASPP